MMLPTKTFTLDTLIERIRARTIISHLQAETVVRTIVDILRAEADKGDLVDLYQLTATPPKSKLIKTTRRAQP